MNAIPLAWFIESHVHRLISIAEGALVHYIESFKIGKQFSEVKGTFLWYVDWLIVVWRLDWQIRDVNNNVS